MKHHGSGDRTPKGFDVAQPYSHDLCVLIGRFQPFHIAHLRVVEIALKRGRHVLVLIGSAGAPRSHRNPFTYAERADMIRLSVDERYRGRLITLPLEDCCYNDTQWVANAQKQVNTAIAQTGVSRGGDPAAVALIGHSRDHPITFVTVDACVVTAACALLVRRKGRPGKGLWALPGGFLGQTETVVDGMLRELREKTKIAVPPGMLRGSIVAQRVFDDPNRSSRGRTITHGFLIQLKNETALPGLRSRKPRQAESAEIGADDDAEKAQWWPLADIKREMMFEDHYDIILALTALI